MCLKTVDLGWSNHVPKTIAASLHIPNNYMLKEWSSLQAHCVVSITVCYPGLSSSGTKE